MPPNDRDEQDKASASQPAPSQAPAISLPKGGGAIRGIGEKFADNPVTGNGPFGFGWSVSIPAITRKTDKSLPHPIP